MTLLETKADYYAWLDNRKRKGEHYVEKVGLSRLSDWFFNENKSQFIHKSNKFFKVKGILFENELIGAQPIQQPIVVQPENGVLGFLQKSVNDEIFYLIQAKLEPGNPGLIQLSPTIQATYSNLTKVHGGKNPKFSNIFWNPKPYKKKKNYVFKHLLSETASRFLDKSNYNIVIRDNYKTSKTFEEFAYIPERLIKELLFCDFGVNMNARSLLSISLGVSINPSDASDLINWLNDLRIEFPSKRKLITLRDTKNWVCTKDKIYNPRENIFEIAGIKTVAKEREVKEWYQPILFHSGKGICGLISKIYAKKEYFLIQGKPEPGAKNFIELAPTVSYFGDHSTTKMRKIVPFLEMFLDKPNFEFSVLHSEEGGRFDHFINNYCLLKIHKSIDNIPPNFRWTTLNELKAANLHEGIVSSELRTLIALIEARKK